MNDSTKRIIFTVLAGLPTLLVIWIFSLYFLRQSNLKFADMEMKEFKENLDGMIDEALRQPLDFIIPDSFTGDQVVLKYMFKKSQRLS